ITMSKVQKDAFKSAEEKAKADRLGLWVSGDPIAPWIFRGEKGDEPEVVKNTPVNSTANTHTPNPDAPPVSVLPAVVKPPTTEQTRKYILGPRGGCYYLNEQGAKTYVRNKELCNKP
ncbi:MAG: hypothetical protein ACRD6X_20945, partial [Pyrinomonadaceae bacterium]